MKMSALFLLLLCFLAWSGCELFGVQSRSGSSRADDDVPKIVIDRMVEPGEYPDDPYSIVEVVGTDTLSDDHPAFPIVRLGTLTSDTIALRVSYAGGCKAHTFQLVGSDAFMESIPVQSEVHLFHDAHGDTCEALVTDTLHFDLAPLKVALLNAYRAEKGEMLLSFFLGDTERLLVRYEVSR